MYLTQNAEHPVHKTKAELWTLPAQPQSKTSNAHNVLNTSSTQQTVLNTCKQSKVLNTSIHSIAYWTTLSTMQGTKNLCTQHKVGTEHLCTWHNVLNTFFTLYIYNSSTEHLYTTQHTEHMYTTQSTEHLLSYIKYWTPVSNTKYWRPVSVHAT